MWGDKRKEIGMEPLISLGTDVNMGAVVFLCFGCFLVGFGLAGYLVTKREIEPPTKAEEDK